MVKTVVAKTYDATIVKSESISPEDCADTDRTVFQCKEQRKRQLKPSSRTISHPENLTNS